MTGAGGVSGSGSGSGSGSVVSAVDSVVVCADVLTVVVGIRLAATVGRADAERVAVVDDVVDVEPRATTDAACASNANNAITAAHITPPCMNVF